MNLVISKIRDEARAYVASSTGSHGWDHTERVLRLALHIGRIEGANLHVIELAALLHDIGRSIEDESLGEICHAEAGAHIARDILQQHHVDPDIVDRTVHCIEHHRFRGQRCPDTLEAKIVFDADKLDSIGAIGIGRAFLFAGEHGAKLHNAPGVDPINEAEYGPEDTAYREFLHKLRHVPERLLTREGRRIAEERHAFMLQFFKRLAEEAEGKI
jgi:uncharacterized protein